MNVAVVLVTTVQSFAVPVSSNSTSPLCAVVVVTVTIAVSAAVTLAVVSPEIVIAIALPATESIATTNINAKNFFMKQIALLSEY
ncbi:MAG: hypothetical protein IJQ74_05160 [Synergistaceae bacterium]|nr:hypothetical protein [Synergistaceae bacterium]